MFDLGWTELLVLGAVAIIVVGPKDLPKLMRSIGQISNSMKRMAGEFRSALDDAGRVEELSAIKKDFDDLSRMEFDPTEPATRPFSLDELDKSKKNEQANNSATNTKESVHANKSQVQE